MNAFRGIFNRLTNRRRPGQPGGGDDDDNDGTSPGVGSEAHPKKAPPRKLPRQYNSDWNEIVEESGDTNLFFNIFNAPQQAADDARETILTQNKAKVRR